MPKAKKIPAVVKVIGKIKELMEANQGMQRLAERYNYVQYKKIGADENWKDDQCHYEFLSWREESSETHFVNIHFHCEGGEHKRTPFWATLDKVPGISRNPNHFNGYESKEFPLVLIPTNPSEKDVLDVAQKAVDEMKGFVAKYGDAIDRAIEIAAKGGATMNNATTNTKLLDDCIELLKNNRNIILHGAPGTGKTYLAKKIAKQLIFSDDMPEDKQKAKWNEQFDFVQFHQSYDYTDFVEGLRPVQENGGGIGFERKDGVFKEFCKAALAKRKSGGVDNFGECFDKLLKMIGDLDDGDALEIPKRVKEGTFRVALNAGGDGLVYACLEDGKYVVREREGRYFNRNQCYNVYRGMPGMPSGALDSYMKAIVDYMKTNKDIGLEEYKPGEDDKSGEASRKFVFVIDEINRGEMSKIFGELFYCIEPDYRGSGHKIKTQYQNLVPPGDDFKEGFFIPENVYIIGTMNDIDRSVESMDFAMRRRFAFKEVTAAETCGAMFRDGKDWKKGGSETVDVSSCLDEIKMRMRALNEAICPESADKSERKRTGLTRAYHIGGAYFLKFAKYFTGGNAEEAFQSLWDNHLEGLLREYLRGMDDARESKLGELKAAYKNAEQKVAADSVD